VNPKAKEQVCDNLYILILNTEMEMYLKFQHKMILLKLLFEELLKLSSSPPLRKNLSDIRGRGDLARHRRPRAKSG
jgi:hypothetical protein